MVQYLQAFPAPHVPKPRTARPQGEDANAGARPYMYSGMA